MRATRELAPEAWSEYFDALSRELLNAPVSIEVLGGVDAEIAHASELNLLTLRYDRARDVFEIAAARDGTRLASVLRHLVDHPERVAVDNDTMLAPLMIEVDGPDRMRTLIAIEDLDPLGF